MQILIRPEAPTESPRKKVPTKDVSSMETANSADESDESSSSNKENEVPQIELSDLRFPPEIF